MAVLLLTSAGFARLGVWQLSRLRERRAANVAILAARRAPPVPILPGSSHTDTLREHRVTARYLDLQRPQTRRVDSALTSR